MKNNLRDKFRDFLASEEGRVGVKAPLAAGILGGSLLLAQTMLPSAAQAHGNHDGCPPCGDLICQAEVTLEWSPTCTVIPGVQGCWVHIVTHYSCI